MDLLDVLAADRAKLGPIGKEMFAELDAGLEDMFAIKSECLPENLRGKKSVTPYAAIVKRLDAIDLVKTKESEKAQKKINIEKYRQQVENGQEIDYDINEDKQYRKQTVFIGAFLIAGIIEEV